MNDLAVALICWAVVSVTALVGLYIFLMSDK